MIIFSDFQQGYIWLPFIGFLIGMLATTIGSGGGFFFPMILILFFHIPAHIAVPTSLAAGIPLSLTGTVGHYYQGNIAPRTGFVFGVAGIAGALGGAVLTRFMASDQLSKVFGIYAILLALIIGINSTRKKKDKKHIKEAIATRHGLSLAYGFAGGIISGTFGTSGAAPVFAGLMSMQLPVKKVIGTSLLVVFINTIAAFASHMLIGEVNVLLVVLLTMGSVAGALTGPYILTGINTENHEVTIKIVFAFIALILGIVLLTGVV
jgi:uncharacterized protein